MSIDTTPTAQSDLEALTRQLAAGAPRDPELLRRIEARAAAIRERLAREQGPLDVAVDLIRAGRDEGP